MGFKKAWVHFLSKVGMLSHLALRWLEGKFKFIYAGALLSFFIIPCWCLWSEFFFQYHQGWHLLVPYGRPGAKRFGWLSLKETRWGEGTIFKNIRKMRACSPDTSLGLCEWLKSVTPDSHCLCMRNQMGYKYCPWTVYLPVPGHGQSLQHNLLLLPTTCGNTTLCSSQI